MAIVRFDDTDVGQKNWGVESLYGTTNLKPDRDTAAWLGLWNVLTWGKTGADGIAWFKGSVKPPGSSPRDQVSSYVSEPACAEHRFFAPLNGAVVFDHLVTYDRLKGIPLLFLTGKLLSKETIAAAQRCVAEGATCIIWKPLAAAHGIAQHPSGANVVRHGSGKFVLTDDFQSPETVRHFRRFLGKPDEISYRFAGRTVTLTRVTDNTVDVRITTDSQNW